MADKANVRVTHTGILVNGIHRNPGDVLSKSEFANKGDWQNLAFSFEPARVEETDDPVGPADAPVGPADAPVAKVGKLPGA